MITPSKFIPYEQSIIYKMLVLLRGKKEEVSIVDLYTNHELYFGLIDEFMFSIDALYVLNKIEVDFEKGTVLYVG